METTVITFDITSSFEDWAKYDDSLPTQKNLDLGRYTEVTKKITQTNVLSSFQLVRVH